MDEEGVQKVPFSYTLL